MKKELYVVGLIPEPVKSYIFEYQKKLSTFYGLYDNRFPELHITLARLNYENPDEALKLCANLDSVLSNIYSENAEIQGISCFGPPFKSVSLHINTTPGLKTISDLIINAAKQAGLSVLYPFDTWQYHITVASPIFAKREWSESEYEQACELLKNSNISISFTMDHIQLWHPVLEDYVVKSYYLKKNCT